MTLNVVRDRPCARLLPSRRHFALTRLVAYARLRAAPLDATGATHVIHAIDRDQTASEMFGVSFGLWMVLSCYTGAALPLSAPLAAVGGLLLGCIALQVAVVGMGLLTGVFTRAENRIKLNSTLLMVALLLLSSWVATLPHRVRYVAWFCLGAMALNALAATILRLLRNAVRAAEERCVN